MLCRAPTAAPAESPSSSLGRHGTGSAAHEKAKANWQKTACLEIERLASEGDPWEEQFAGCTPERAVRHVYDPDSKSWSSHETLAMVQDEPFDQGAMRLCYRMKLSEAADTPPEWGLVTNFVAKRYIAAENNDEAVREDVVVQMEAKYWAERFNEAARRVRAKPVEMIYITLVQFPDRDGEPLYCVERFIEGKYVKYNSNCGFVRDEADGEPDAEAYMRKTPQAFSHFTWEASRGELIVVDIQGVGDLYTDPQLHSLCPSCDGKSSANLGVRGMAYFFASHKCNDICHAMQLTPVTTCPSDAATLMPDSPKPAQSLPLLRQSSNVGPSALKRMKSHLKSARHVRHSFRGSEARGRYSVQLPPVAQDLWTMDMAQSVRVIPDEIPRAPRWQQSAAGKIHLELARMHCYGVLADSPADRDLVASLFHFRMAAQLGHPEAVWNLAKMYQVCRRAGPAKRSGQGLPGMLQDLTVEEDSCMANALTLLAASQGVKEALFMGARSPELETSQRIQFYQQAIESGGGEAQWGNAVYQLRAGLAALVLADDPEHACELYMEAAEQAMENCMMKLWEQYTALAEQAAAQVQGDEPEPEPEPEPESEPELAREASVSSLSELQLLLARSGFSRQELLECVDAALAQREREAADEIAKMRAAARGGAEPAPAAPVAVVVASAVREDDEEDDGGADFEMGSGAGCLLADY